MYRSWAALTKRPIKQGSSLIPGIDAIDDADMLFLFLRFLKPEDAWMEKFEAYLKRGGPVLGLRTTTHAFNGTAWGMLIITSTIAVKILSVVLAAKF